VSKKLILSAGCDEPLCRVFDSKRRTIPWLSRLNPKRLPFVKMLPALCA
jgi:hypothetical protein